MRTSTLLPILVALAGCGRRPPAPVVDIAVVAVELIPSPAGHASTAQVTVANRGSRTLEPQDYVVGIEAPGTPDEMRANACGQRTHVFLDVPASIAPGASVVIPVHHIFARAGAQELTVRATLQMREDGTTKDDAVTLTRTVPRSPCPSGLASR